MVFFASSRLRVRILQHSAPSLLPIPNHRALLALAGSSVASNLKDFGDAFQGDRKTARGDCAGIECGRGGRRVGTARRRPNEADIKLAIGHFELAIQLDTSVQAVNRSGYLFYEDE